MIGHSEKKITCVTVMLLVLADGNKFPSHVILNQKKCLRGNCIEHLLLDANLKVGWKDWLLMVWNRGPGDDILMHLSDMYHQK